MQTADNVTLPDADSSSMALNSEIEAEAPLSQSPSKNNNDVVASPSTTPQPPLSSGDDNAVPKSEHVHVEESSPARPETVSSTMAGGTTSNAGDANEIDYGTWEFEPPLANIRRLLKQILPKGTNISKDSVTALSRASGLFVLYLTNCASDVAREGRRSTIAAKDIMAALKELDLGEFIPDLEQFLSEHREYERNKKDEKDRIKKLHADGSGGGNIGFGNKRGIRGADGKYVGATSLAETASAGISKENDKNVLTDDEIEKTEDTVPQTLVQEDLVSKHKVEYDEEGGDTKKRKLDNEESNA
eukprot:CCRYP_016013-RA/>CCRYP_016013-RA protein AED:0.33 eAED:0.33 QI:308/1/1/1/1/1/4/437/301